MEAELLIGVRTEVQLVMRKHGLTLLKSLCPLAILAAIFGLIAVVPAQADNLAYNDPSISQSNSQAWTGNLALDFTVNSSINVTALGVFNFWGNGVITGPIEVVIYDTDTNAAVTPVMTFAGSYALAGFGFDVLQTITPVTLGPGHYAVDAYTFSAADPDGNQNFGSPGPTLNNGGGAITFTGSGFDGNHALDDAGFGCEGYTCTPAQFDAGTFAFTVPEPSAVILLLAFLALMAPVGVLARRKARANC
jgi:hypothetical protein